jgi:hypothetical protein
MIIAHKRYHRYENVSVCMKTCSEFQDSKPNREKDQDSKSNRKIYQNVYPTVSVIRKASKKLDDR